jgi:hypothetical protein
LGDAEFGEDFLLIFDASGHGTKVVFLSGSSAHDAGNYPFVAGVIPIPSFSILAGSTLEKDFATFVACGRKFRS